MNHKVVAFASHLFFGLFAACLGAQTCMPAVVTSYDAVPNNPVNLTTIASSDPVIASQFNVRGNPPFQSGAGNLAILFASCGQILPQTIDPLINGQLLLDPNCLLTAINDAVNGAGNGEWNLDIPGVPALVGFTFYLQSVHYNSMNGQWNFSNGLACTIGVGGVDRDIVGISLPSNLVGGDPNPRPYGVTILNHGDQMSAPTNVTVSIGPFSATASVPSIPPAGVVNVTVFLLTPFASGPLCGGTQTYSVSATLGSSDCDNGNNSLAVNASVQVPHWDIQLELLNVPNSAVHCFNTSWQVRVTNAGNVVSPPNLCFQTGISLFSGSGNLGSNLGWIFLNAPSLAPGNSTTFNISYNIPCGALFNTTQYVKTFLSVSCPDMCTAGNYDQESIVIL